MCLLVDLSRTTASYSSSSEIAADSVFPSSIEMSEIFVVSISTSMSVYRKQVDANTPRSVISAGGIGAIQICTR